MSQNGFSSVSTQVQIGDGASPENFVTIANVKDIDGMKLSGNMHDTLDSFARHTLDDSDHRSAQE